MLRLSLVVCLAVALGCSSVKFTGQNKEKKKTTQTPPPAGDPPVVAPPTPVPPEVTPPVTPPAPEPQTLRLSIGRINHDALFKSCLHAQLNDGEEKMVGCNKDFANLPEGVTLKGQSFDNCNVLKLEMRTYEPENKNDCIAAIQANRDNHKCVYRSSPFRTASPGDGDGRIKFPVNEQKRVGKKLKMVGYYEDFEPIDKGDFNDFVFAIQTDGVALRIAGGASYCD